jgi:hypothetical protein
MNLITGENMGLLNLAVILLALAVGFLALGVRRLERKPPLFKGDPGPPEPKG